jgi:hypothetical protein
MVNPCRRSDLVTQIEYYSPPFKDVDGSYIGYKAKSVMERIIDLAVFDPTEEPSPENKFIFIVHKNSKRCPACLCMLIPADFNGRRCLACRHFIAYKGETVEDVIATRKNLKYHSYDLEKPGIFLVSPLMVMGQLVPVITKLQ